jgi:mRNA interferase RelE/StbE
MTSKFEIRWSHEAVKLHKKLGSDYQERFKRMVKVLEESPHYYGKAIKRLMGDLGGLHRYRVGKLRIFYTISSSDRVIYISNIDTRGDAY